MKKVAIIGCNSFTGGYVVDELLAQGEYQVLGVDREEKSGLFLPYLAQDVRNFRFAKIDLNRDIDALLTLLRSEQPDYVMNLAALSEVAPSWEHPEQWMQTNVVALTQLADGLRTVQSLQKFVQISTPEVYGSVSGNVAEDAPLNPSTPYAVSKAAFDLLLLAFVKQYGFPAVLMRAANVYGAHQQLFKIVPRTIIYARLGKKLPLHGGGQAQRAFIHARDAARAYIAAFTDGRVGEVYHVAPAKTIMIRELVQRICKLFGEDIAEVTLEAPARPGHDAVYSLDAGKATRELRWEPTIALEDGLSETIRWVDASWMAIRNEALDYVHRA